MGAEAVTAWVEISYATVAKAVMYSQEQSFMPSRKAFLGFRVQRKKYSKRQILEMYLNNTYFGNGACGIEENASLRWRTQEGAEI